MEYCCSSCFQIRHFANIWSRGQAAIAFSGTWPFLLSGLTEFSFILYFAEHVIVFIFVHTAIFSCVQRPLAVSFRADLPKFRSFCFVVFGVMFGMPLSNPDEFCIAENK